MLTILLIILVLILIGALPTWPYSAGWGYYPSGTLGIIVIVLVVLLLLGRISAWRPSQLSVPDCDRCDLGTTHLRSPLPPAAAVGRRRSGVAGCLHAGRATQRGWRMLQRNAGREQHKHGLLGAR